MKSVVFIYNKCYTNIALTNEMENHAQLSNVIPDMHIVIIFFHVYLLLVGTLL